MASEFIPLHHIPISIVVNEVVVHGEVEWLIPTDIRVVITTPTTGFGAQLHVPHFAMSARALATPSGRHTRSMTPYGEESARWLLAQIYAYTRGKRDGWGVYAIQDDGTWVDLRDGSQEGRAR